MRCFALALVVGFLLLCIANDPQRDSIAYDEISAKDSQNLQIAVIDVDAVFRKCELTRVAKEKINAELDERKAAILKTKKRLETLTGQVESGEATSETGDLAKECKRLREDISFQERYQAKLEERYAIVVKAEFQKELQFVLEEISREKGFDLVFSTPVPSDALNEFATDVIAIEEIQNGALLYPSGLDITQLVIDRLD